MSNEAKAYGVEVIAVPADRQAPSYWCATDVVHLAAEENQGRHHIYVNVYGADGQSLRGRPGVMVFCRWQGQREDERCPPVALDKPVGEDMANVVMYAGQVLTVWIESTDGYASERVTGLSTAHPDEGEGNTWGHHSFRVTFRLTAAYAQQPEGPEEPGAPVEPAEPDGEELSRTEIIARLQAIHAEIDELLSRLSAAKG